MPAPTWPTDADAFVAGCRVRILDAERCQVDAEGIVADVVTAAGLNWATLPLQPLQTQGSLLYVALANSTDVDADADADPAAAAAAAAMVVALDNRGGAVVVPATALELLVWIGQPVAVTPMADVPGLDVWRQEALASFAAFTAANGYGPSEEAGLVPIAEVVPGRQGRVVRIHPHARFPGQFVMEVEFRRTARDDDATAAPAAPRVFTLAHGFETRAAVRSDVATDDGFEPRGYGANAFAQLLQSDPAKVDRIAASNPPPLADAAGPWLSRLYRPPPPRWFTGLGPSIDPAGLSDTVEV